MKIHHLGIVVSSIEKSVHILSKMGYQQTGSITKDTIQNNRIVFMCHSGALTVELIEPLNESSTVYNAGLGYHHICYELEQGEDIIETFKISNVGKIFTRPLVAPALDNRTVVFACLKDGNFIELIIE